MAGYLCIGLALMNDTASAEDINRVVKESTRRPALLQQAAVALGKLGDKRVAETLQGLLTEGGELNLAKLSAIASALGFIGDSRTVEPLKAMLFNDKLGPLSRAFAAVALGGVADKEMLPWNSKIGVNVNYRAAVEVLTNRQSGILDIL
jgi:HEAT repeat protein